VTAKPAPQDGVVEAELAKDLRHLSDVAEQVRKVAHGHRRAERLRDAMAARQVPDERLAAHEEFIRHVVPRPDEDAAFLDQFPQPRLLVRAQLQVVFEHDRLAVEMEVLVVRLALHEVEQAIDEPDEAEAELLVTEVPLAIPMGVGNNVDIHQIVSTPNSERPTPKENAPGDCFGSWALGVGVTL
jgi:hypothetical protein